MDAPVLCIVGPTCSGKSALAMAIARHMRAAEIVGADSRQVYREVDIGTAKPSPEERAAVPHHCIDTIDPASPYSAGRYAADALAAIAGIRLRGGVALLVGGSGLYLRALIDGMLTVPPANPAIRAALEERVVREGAAVLHEELVRVDPDTAKAMREVTRRRVVRALEVYEATGIPLSTWRRRAPERTLAARMVALDWERAALYARIDARVDAMMHAGLLDEVRGLAARGLTEALPALQTTGYVELFAHLRGDVSLEAAVALIKQRTRNYAKRQLTWFRNDPRIRWIRVDERTDFALVAADVLDPHAVA